jgi:hypothetical protein
MGMYVIKKSVLQDLLSKRFPRVRSPGVLGGAAAPAAPLEPSC